MTAGLGIDRLLDFLFECLEMFKFWLVVDEYEQVVVLTLGKPRRKNPVLDPGIHIVWPFGIEEFLADNVVPCDLADLEIDMTLKDGTPLHVEFSALWKITDIQKFKLEVEDADTVLTNVQGMVQEYLFQYEWEELLKLRAEGIGDRRQGLPWKLRTHCNQEVRQWGAELTNFYIQSFIVPNLKQGVIKAL
jgi:regulator of protease activity HflC (stomatin/prohibitin superfamily)